MVSLSVLSIFVVLIWTNAAADTEITGTDGKCAEFCSKTYSDRTVDTSISIHPKDGDVNEQTSVERSCSQGCRLFSIISAVEKVNAVPDGLLGSVEEKQNVTSTSMECDEECREAYSNSTLQRACMDGCEHQTPFTADRFTVVVDDSSPFYPFVKKLMSKAMGSFGDFEKQIKSQFENVRKLLETGSPFDKEANRDPQDGADRAELFRSFQRMTERLRKIIGSSELDENKPRRLLGGPEDVGDHARNHGRNSSDGPLVAETRPTHSEGKEFGGTPVGNADDIGDPIIVVKMIDDEDEVEVPNLIAANEPSPPTGNDIMYIEPDDGFLACLARRSQELSMLSRWLLCATLMLSMLCMFWLCLSLMRSQHYRRRRMYTQYRADKADLIYFMPPPAYEKSSALAAYMPLDAEQKMPPPPAYEAHLTVETEKGEEEKNKA